MAQVKRGKRKFAERQLRGVNAGRRLARKTQNRAQNALAAVLGGGYNPGDLLDDVMEGASDLMDALWGAGSSNSGLPVAAFRFPAGTVFPPPPAVLPRRLVDLTDTVTAGQIDLGDLWGVREEAGVQSAARIPAAGIYRLRLPEAPNNIVGALTPDEVDEIVVEVQAIPPNQNPANPPSVGLYRGMLTLQNSPVVLAEIVILIT
jgi:hypothetical protein